MRYKGRILHRDISINNIMYEIRDGAYYFVLIDFDMAIVVEDRRGKSTYHTSSKHRTGTLPFMAWELIKDATRGMNNPDWIPIPHLLRHDYESLFYVSFWSVTAIPTPDNRKDKDELEGWAKQFDGSSLKALAAAKKDFLTSPMEPELMEASAAAQGLCEWFWGFSEVLRNGLVAQQDHNAKLFRKTPEEKAAINASFDFTTLNGHLTKDTLKAGLKPYIPGQNLLSVHTDTARGNPEHAELVPIPAALAAPDSVEPSDTADRKQRSTQAHHETEPGRAQDDLRDRRRNVRKNRMTVDQAMAAEQYRNTRLRPRKPRVYY